MTTGLMLVIQIQQAVDGSASSQCLLSRHLHLTMAANQEQCTMLARVVSEQHLPLLHVLLLWSTADL